jgi:hypothetical protein
LTSTLDQVRFGITVNTGTNATFEDVLAAVQGSGLGAQNFVGLNSYNLVGPAGTGPAPTIDWSFSLSAPLSKMKETIASLTALRNAVAVKRMTLTFNVSGPQASSSQPCPLSDLVADARAQAQKLVDAAGLSLGPILAMSTAAGTSSAAVFVPLASFLVGVPSTGSPCALTVKFGLTRF